MSAHAIFAAAFGYLLGSIPWGIVLTRVTGAGNLREIGSGSTGATNVLRTGRKGLAAATLLLDLLKGLCAVLIAGALWPGAAPLAAIGAVAGHCYPVWLRFNGGKGVATMMGVVLGLAWPLGLVFAVVWLGLLAVLRISSVAGMSAAISAPLAAWALGYSEFIVAGVVMAALVLWRHRSNIARLMAGQEPRVGGKGPSR
ncbi:glycerol-3-phosphate 1-O-acyltransferase PlsY [uncultured Croceicoccus sp.]|uniref:glycerol-3-phosphate 1-O-acyltransferase PlsY n=1 Tax=uncultured Croceicoccus sp. TaxID=1295329 RepID=UPI0026326AC7|nr:glycerol-3-phosphate 1-O-acyltransferase PlsY [uncultured Croceicoccus sp.]